MTQSLLLYNNNYALIHNRTLLVNSMVLTAMCEFITQQSEVDSEQIALMFGEAANKVVAAMTDKEVSRAANGLVTKSILNNGASCVVEHCRTKGKHDEN